MIVGFSDQNLVDPRQIGWINHREGDAVLRCKVIVSKAGHVFLSHPTAYRNKLAVPVIEYEDRALWNLKAQDMLEKFRTWMGRVRFDAAVARVDRAG